MGYLGFLLSSLSSPEPNVLQQKVARPAGRAGSVSSSITPATSGISPGWLSGISEAPKSSQSLKLM